MFHITQAFTASNCWLSISRMMFEFTMFLYYIDRGYISCIYVHVRSHYFLLLELVDVVNYKILFQESVF